MAYTIRVSRAAERQIARLPADIQTRVRRAIEALGEDPRPPGSRKLQGGGDQYRIRVGDYRIVYEIQDELLLVLVVRVGRRDSVY